MDRHKRAPDRATAHRRRRHTTYGDTGLEWGGLHVWTDPNVPLAGTQALDQVVVCDPTEVWIWKSPTPMLSVISQPEAADLQVVVRLYGYAAQIVCYPSCVRTINGNSMVVPTF